MNNMALLSDPEDIYAATAPLLYLTRFLGASPLVLNKKSERGYEIKRYLLVISFFVLVTIHSYVIYGLYRAVSGPKINIFEIFYSFWFGTSLTVFIGFGCIRAKEIVEGFRIVFRLDEIFKKLQLDVNNKKLRNVLLLHLVSTISFIALCIVLEIILNIKLPIFYPNMYASFFPVLMILTIEIQYYTYLKAALKRYILLNGVLKRMNSNKFTFDGYIKHGLKRPSERTTDTSDPKFILEMIFELHTQLTQMCKRFNRAFSVQLLLKIGVSFILMIICLYYFYVGLSKSPEQLIQGWLDFSLVVASIITFCILDNFVLVKISHATCKEANSSPLLFHKLKHKCTDRDLLETIDFYSIQLYHNKLEFTVCGMFPMDHTLLYTMTGAITTYLIFLVQFNPADHFRNAFFDVNNTAVRA